MNNPRRYATEVLYCLTEALPLVDLSLTVGNAGRFTFAASWFAGEGLGAQLIYWNYDVTAPELVSIPLSPEAFANFLMAKLRKAQAAA